VGSARILGQLLKLRIDVGQTTAASELLKLAIDVGRTMRYIFRDRDGAYSAAFIRRLTAMGMRDRPVSARSPRGKMDSQRG
jgi:hypothetical protein